MDHMMPGMDGVEAMKRIRSDRAYAEIPIVALTANAVSSARETFLAAGFDGFVSKPIDLMDLERVLRRVLRQSVMTYPAAEAEPEKKESALSSSASVQEAESEQPTAGSAPSVREQLAACGLNPAEGMKYCAEDEGFYLEMLAEFASGYPARAEKMQASLAGDDLHNYEILVHALKSNLKMLGSSALSERARELEFAAKEGRASLIAEQHGALDADCRQLAAALLRITGSSAPEPDGDDEILEFLPEDDAVTEFAPDGEEG
jgi:HPt (histidine-containing phosphotransfer) domain-containing protein